MTNFISTSIIFSKLSNEMQPFYISRVIGKPFSVKFDGEIIPINHDMVLTVGDVFSVRDGKNAWFVSQDGEQIDVLNKAYIVTTKGITALETSAELVYTKPSADEESPPQYRLKTEELIRHGLSNTQAQALILTRYEDYFNSLQVDKDDKAKFEPQVYRISENQYMDINVKDLSSFISGAKSKNFSISSIMYEDEECELTYDSEHFTIVPRVGLGQEIKIKIDLTNGIQYIKGAIIFVVQPVETRFNIKMVTHQIKFINMEEKILVADIISEGFDEKLIKFNIVNDPNHYFFTIENKQLFLTTEGIKSIINKTLSLEEMQVTVRATDDNRTALATIEIPFNSDFQEQITKSNINPIESTRNEQNPTAENVEINQSFQENIDTDSTLEIKKADENLIKSQNSEKNSPEKQKVEKEMAEKEMIEKQISKTSEKNNIIEAQTNKTNAVDKQQIEIHENKNEETNDSIIEEKTNKANTVEKQQAETQTNKVSTVEKQQIEIETQTNKVSTVEKQQTENQTQTNKANTVEKQQIETRKNTAAENNNNITELSTNKTPVDKQQIKTRKNTAAKNNNITEPSTNKIAVDKLQTETHANKVAEKSNNIIEEKTNKANTVEKQQIGTKKSRARESNNNITKEKTKKTSATGKQKIEKQESETQTNRARETTISVIEAQINKTKAVDKQKFETQTSKAKEIKTQSSKIANKKTQFEKRGLLTESNSMPAKNATSNTYQLKEKNGVQSKTIFENKESKHDQTMHKIKNDNQISLQGFSKYKEKKSASINSGKNSPTHNLKAIQEEKEQKIAKSRKMKKEIAAPVEPYHFHLDRNNIITEHIANFVPTHDSINLTAILALKEKRDINKHLYIEKDKSGKMMLNISPAGNGEINTQFIFDDININKIAQFYNLNISDLSEEQISHVIIDSMLKNSNLIVSASKA